MEAPGREALHRGWHRRSPWRTGRLPVDGCWLPQKGRVRVVGESRERGGYLYEEITSQQAPMSGRSPTRRCLSVCLRRLCTSLMISPSACLAGKRDKPRRIGGANVPDDTYIAKDAGIMWACWMHHASPRRPLPRALSSRVQLAVGTGGQLLGFVSTSRSMLNS